MSTNTKALSVNELNLSEMAVVNGGSLFSFLEEAADKVGRFMVQHEKDIKAHTIGVVTAFFSNAHVGKYLKDEYKKNH